MPLLCKVPWAPCNGTPTPPKLVVTLPFPHHSTLQWHPAKASNGTTSTPLKLVVTLPPNHSTLQWQPTMAPAWCHVQSAKVVRRPPPFLEVRTPIAISLSGEKSRNKKQLYPSTNHLDFYKTSVSRGIKVSSYALSMFSDLPSCKKWSRPLSSKKRSMKLLSDNFLPKGRSLQNGPKTPRNQRL